MKKLALICCLIVLAGCQSSKKSPQALEQLELQGISNLQSGNLDAAQQTLQTVLSDSPDRWKSYNALGIVQSLKNDFAGAEVSFAKANSFNPDNPAVLNNWGLVQAMNDHYEDAIARLMQAVEAAPTDNRTQPEMNLAMIYALSGNEKSAEVILHRYLTPDKIKKNLSFYASLRSDRDKAQAAIQKAYQAPQTILPDAVK